MNLHRTSQTLRAVCGLLLVTFVIAACAIEGGVPEASAPTTAAPLPQATDSAAPTAQAKRSDTWSIGLLEAPRDLYPYQPTPALQRVVAPISELLFPSPILVFNYGYTSTGVLDRIPTLENGGAALRKADVFLDVAGNITTTATQVITQVDQLVVTYRWNPQLRWSDGTPLTADDSVFAYELARAAPPNDESLDKLAQTLAYEKVDDHTTRAVLRPDFTGANYFMNFWTPLPRHKLTGIAPEQVRESEFARLPVGYGPYKIVSRASNEIRLERNPHYYGRTPDATWVTINMTSNPDLLRANLLNGNLDVITTDRPTPALLAQLAQDAQSKQAQVTFLRNPIWEHIDFNLDVKLLQDIRIRRAIAHGTNRPAMAEALFGRHTQVLSSWIMPDEPEAAPPDAITRYDYNPDEARKLLDQAGFTIADSQGVRGNQDGITLTLQLMTTANSGVRQEIARRFQQDMKAIGIAVDVLELPNSQLNTQLFDPGGPLFLRQFELALFGWGAGPEPGGLSLWSCAAVPSENNGWVGENFAGWCFRDADRAIRRAVTTLSPAERREAYLQQQKAWTQELPSLPLFQRVSAAIVAPRVAGAVPDAFAPITWNIAEWKRLR